MHTKEIVSFKRNPGRQLSLLKAIGKSNNCFEAVFCEKRDAIEKVVRLQWFHPFTYLSNKPIIHPQSISDYEYMKWREIKGFENMHNV